MLRNRQQSVVVTVVSRNNNVDDDEDDDDDFLCFPASPTFLSPPPPTELSLHYGENCIAVIYLSGEFWWFGDGKGRRNEIPGRTTLQSPDPPALPRSIFCISANVTGRCNPSMADRLWSHIVVAPHYRPLWRWHWPLMSDTSEGIVQTGTFLYSLAGGGEEEHTHTHQRM